MTGSPLTTAADRPVAQCEGTEPVGYRYHLLRAATARFKCNIPTLTDQQRLEAERQAAQTFSLEERVLHSREARDVLIPGAQLDRALAEVEQRYSNADEMDEDLARNGMDREQLGHALRRELIFDAVMQRVGAAHAAVTGADERLFYELHQDRFRSPEHRTVRHILITINEDYPENHRQAARARLDAIADRIGPDGNREAVLQRFISEARLTSECPTAMEGGRLGRVSRGQLYQSLDQALFEMDEGAVSGILESELGFHLLLCERIHPERRVPFKQVRPRIRKALEQRRRKERQREWLATLEPAPMAVVSSHADSQSDSRAIARGAAAAFPD